MFKITNDYFRKISETIDKDKSSKNKLFPYNGVGFIYGLPASRKTTIALDTIKSMDFKFKLYIDCDSKSLSQSYNTFKDLDEVNIYYRNSLLESKEPIDVFEEILNALKKDNISNFCIIVDTWHQIIDDENKNIIAKQIMKKARVVATKYNGLIVFVAHVGKTNTDIRGASAVSGDATFKLLIKSSDIEDEFEAIVTKDSLGILHDCTVIFKDSNSITKSKIEYSTLIKEKENDLKPRDYAVQITMLDKVNSELSKSSKYSIGDFRDWLYDNFNRINKFKPSDELFCSNRFLRDNFVDFTEALFEIEKKGRSKFIVGFINKEDDKRSV